MGVPVDPYLDLVTSEHRDQPNFIATLTAIVQPLADNSALLAALPAKFDIDFAIGAQLDALGQWLGETRQILGGLPDVPFRFICMAAAFTNHWDGSVGTAYNDWNVAFNNINQIVIQDNGNLSMTIGLTGQIPTPITAAIFTGGYIRLKPVGVRVKEYGLPTVAEAPLFGFDAHGDGMDGFDNAGWAIVIEGTS